VGKHPIDQGCQIKSSICNRWTLFCENTGRPHFGYLVLLEYFFEDSPRPIFRPKNEVFGLTQKAKKKFFLTLSLRFLWDLVPVLMAKKW
jgi:hypothetical protein